jgi:hypothetical protein
VKRLTSIVLLASLSLLCWANSSPELASIEKKLHHIESNGAAAHPDQTPTVLTEKEVNAYIASDNVKLPEGVKSVRLVGASGVITGTAKVDFDKVREGAHSSNPLLGIFTGVHEVVVVAHGHGTVGKGYVHVDSVSLDGVEVPHLILELFVEKFLTPKYPQIGIDSQFALPNRIDTATVGEHQLTIVQK